jgi:hypothetical protein
MCWRVTRSPRHFCVASLASLVATFALAGSRAELRADEPSPPRTSSRPTVAAPADVLQGRSDVWPNTPGNSSHRGPRIEAGAATVTTHTSAVPGARVTLEINRGSTEWSHFFWTQIEGPSVKIDDPTAPAISVVIPSGADRLAFLFVASSPDLVRVFRLNVPITHGPLSPSPAIESSRAPGSAPTAASADLRANAGDDQVGLVGHRVTLNGTRSLPADAKAARWVQVGGPAVFAPEQQGLYYSFVPGQPGTYRFALLVSARGEISEPDEVSVLVGSPPAGPVPGVSGGPFGAPANTAPGWGTTPEQVVSTALPNLPDSPRIAGSVADILDAICERCSLYASFAELQSELSRRLDGVIPTDPSQRAAWIQNVFLPLTSLTASELLTGGVDIRVRAGIEQVLTPAQQERIRNYLQKMAKAFRAFAASR